MTSGTISNHTRLLRMTGFFAYLCSGTPLITNWAAERLDQLQRPNFALLLWTLFYLLFGVLYLALTNNLGSRRYLGTKLAGLVAMTVCSLAVGWYSHSGLSAILIVVSAVVLPWLVPLWPAVLWLVLSNLALAPIFASFPEYNYSMLLALMQTSIYIGFAAIAFVASLVASQQAEQREAQRRLNSELRATRALLAESTRIAERMRIARELHDLVGHHLTALSLNLEVASHLTNEAAAEHVRKAQDTARHLLSDVREAVSELRQDDAIDLTQALRSLIEGVPSLAVHVETPPRFSVEDPRRAQVLLRCAQEIITNTARHAGARNLWLAFSHDEPGVLCLQARDDGRGAPHFQPGNGLSGMRERLQEFGGSVAVDRGAAQGFALAVRLPLGETPALAHAPSRAEPPALSLS
ncbi:sensor histidine kinase [Fulvimonas soli]|jgi:signal transduction histidine kinase|uniref:Signal transduction histidine kinase n=1 Tax=Fulvimonas soli TaxID=155197 RepID=A0A316HMX7_9GAMM|nr:sensor histidine kinase [Fulvimonas soli]PWK81362.1 signal transduction histidine kinase [Fulvimonas soli]TNY26167.1 two-component sensor histidine kinase [Fulvimonas soli]